MNFDKNILGDLKDVFSETPSCLKLVSKEGSLLMMNPKGLELIEVDSFEIVDGACVYDLVEESHRENFIKFNERICSGNKGSLVFEIVGLKGTRRWMETFASPFKLSTGEICHIAITNDITDKILLEESNLLKERALSESARLSSLGKFVGGVAHEINNPLAIITAKVAYLKMYLNKNGQIDNETLEKTLTQIEETSIRMAKIVDSLKSFSKSPNKKDNGVYDAQLIVEETINLSRNKLKTNGIETHESFQSANIYCNPVELSQVIINLLNNAIDALEEIDVKRIDVSVINQKGKKCIISIKDSGVGVPENIRDKIMDPFFSTKGFGKGTGLGLSISQEIINRYRGKIYYNRESKNTEFIIEMPIIKTKK